MEMEGNCLSNRLWKWKGTLWATAYGNGRGLFGNRLGQQCLTVYGNSVLQLMIIMSYSLYVVK
jgi:hypothetical protein